jgi:hypothetical protein
VRDVGDMRKKKEALKKIFALGQKHARSRRS